MSYLVHLPNIWCSLPEQGQNFSNFGAAIFSWINLYSKIFLQQIRSHPQLRNDTLIDRPWKGWRSTSVAPGFIRQSILIAKKLINNSRSLKYKARMN